MSNLKIGDHWLRIGPVEEEPPPPPPVEQHWISFGPSGGSYGPANRTVIFAFTFTTSIGAVDAVQVGGFVEYPMSGSLVKYYSAWLITGPNPSFTTDIYSFSRFYKGISALDIGIADVLISQQTDYEIGTGPATVVLETEVSVDFGSDKCGVTSVFGDSTHYTSKTQDDYGTGESYPGGIATDPAIVSGQSEHTYFQANAFNYNYRMYSGSATLIQ